VVGRHRLGLGEDRLLVRGVRIEQRVHRGEVVDVVRQRQPRGGVVRFGARRRRRHRGLERGEVDVEHLGLDDAVLVEEHRDGRQAVRVGHRQPRRRVVRFRARGRRPDRARDVRGQRGPLTCCVFTP
jgi:hypothetical protein